MKHQLSKENIEAIEKAINAPGSPTVEVVVKNEKIVIYQVKSKRVS